MRRAGVREARQDLTSLLEDVRKGREVVITERGRPVARLVPITLKSLSRIWRPSVARPAPSNRLCRRLSSTTGTIACEPHRFRGRGAAWPEPVYLDASALVKLFVPEPESDALNAALIGAGNVVVSDLAVTEMASAIGRRIREHRVPLGGPPSPA
jgi:prevent-host-death family protein